MALKTILPKLQPQITVASDDEGETATVRWKGSLDLIKAQAAGYRIGQPYTVAAGGVTIQGDCKRATVETGPGGLATLSLSLFAEHKTASARSAKKYKEDWELTNSQEMIPISQYAGPSGGANANLRQIELWRNGDDPDLYAAYQYKDGDGTVTLDGGTLKLAEKIRQGIETVMRFSPTIRKVTRYSKGHVAGLGKKLSHIDTPSDAPSGMANAAKAWLKIGDNLSIAGDGTQTRTELWLGADSWDENLYGEPPKRWEFGTI